MQSDIDARLGNVAVNYPSKNFWAGLFVGMFLFGVFTAAGIWITVQIPVALAAPPITYSNVILPSPPVYCAGDTGAFRADVTVHEGGLIQTYTTVTTPAGGNIPDTQGRIGARIYPEAVHFTNGAITFPVPAFLPPGDYVHVRATVSVNKDSRPAFIEIPFKVRPCP